jgi:hypothetical protein
LALLAQPVDAADFAEVKAELEVEEVLADAVDDRVTGTLDCFAGLLYELFALALGDGDFVELLEDLLQAGEVETALTQRAALQAGQQRLAEFFGSDGTHRAGACAAASQNVGGLAAEAALEGLLDLPLDALDAQLTAAASAEAGLDEV